MRQIVFRGRTPEKSYKGSRWIFGDLFRTIGTDGVGIQYWNEEDGWMTEDVHDSTVGEYTNIYDTNGQPIFEGDIIEVTLQHNKQTASTYKAVVEQKEGAFGFRNKQGFCPFYGQTYETFKVVGNIHDNPELMKGGAQ